MGQDIEWYLDFCILFNKLILLIYSKYKSFGGPFCFRGHERFFQSTEKSFHLSMSGIPMPYFRILLLSVGREMPSRPAAWFRFQPTWIITR